MHNALSSKIKSLIENVFYNDNNFHQKERFNAAIERMNARFIVYGTLALRNHPKNKYILNLEALIKHKDAPLIQKKELQNEFQELWNREISFLEEEEINGFKSTSEQVFFAATFMLALATFLDLNYQKGIEINEKLLEYIKENRKHEEYRSKVNRLLASSYFMYSRVLYFNGDIEGAINYRRKFHALTPDEYDACLSEAIFHINRRNDPQTALEFIEKAEKVAKENGTWRYSKFYLFIRLKRHEEALSVLDKIISTDFKSEFDVINQVITYNNHCYKEDPKHIQSFFIIGVIIYKKIKNAPLAYEKLQEFINKSDEIENWDLLRNRAKMYLKEIDRLIGI